jgi:hypothetical protein
MLGPIPIDRFGSSDLASRRTISRQLMKGGIGDESFPRLTDTPKSHKRFHIKKGQDLTYEFVDRVIDTADQLYIRIWTTSLFLKRICIVYCGCKYDVVYLCLYLINPSYWIFCLKMLQELCYNPMRPWQCFLTLLPLLSLHALLS